jgi:hypothetical protein
MDNSGAGRAQLYSSNFLGLSEAASEIARRLANACPTRYSNEAAALDDARGALVAALFEGAVHSEGIAIGGDPGPDDPSEPPQPPEPVQWVPIRSGWWSNERYEQHMVELTDFAIFLKKLTGMIDNDLDDNEIPKEQIIKGAYVIDHIILGWCGDSFELMGVIDDQGYTRIRVPRADIDACFSIETLKHSCEALKDTTVVAANADIAEPTVPDRVQKKKTRPPNVEKAVFGWLEEQCEQHGDDWICDWSNLWLERRYLKRGSLAIGSKGTIRHLIAEWRQERGLPYLKK